MAISTHGFQVDVMPTYQPVNPGLVAFSPTNITQGMLATLQIQDARAKLDAQRKLQEELDALKEKRVRSQGSIYELGAARNESTLNLLPKENAALAATYDTQAAKGASALKDLTFAETLRPNNEKIATLMSETGVKTAPNEALAKLRLSDNTLGEIELNKLKTTDALTNLVVDAELARDAKRADAEAKRALAEKDKAIAADVAERADIAREKIDSGELMNKAKIDARNASLDRTGKQLKEAEDSASRASAKVKAISDRKVTDPTNRKGPLIPYSDLIAVAFDEDPNTGQLITKPGGWFSSGVKLTKTEMDDLRAYQALKKRATEAENYLDEVRQDRRKTYEEFKALTQPAVQAKAAEAAKPGANVIKIRIDEKGNIVK